MSTGFTFKNKGSEMRRISGTKFSHRKSQLLTSTGNMSLDICLGGGQALGTLLLVEEDVSNNYSAILMKYFLAEGVTSRHKLFLATALTSAADILETLPAPFKHSKLARYGWPPPDDELNCAWGQQYAQNLGVNLLFDHEYDLSSFLPRETMENCYVTSCDMCEFGGDASQANTFLMEPYSSVLKCIKDAISEIPIVQEEDLKFSLSLLRIAITPIASPLLLTERNPVSLLRFLYSLKSLLRSTNAIALVTLPTVLLPDIKIRKKVHQFSDYVVRIIPFLDYAENKNPMTKGFHGLFEVVKLPHLNSPLYQNIATDLAFKSYSKTFRIKQLHLPPCIDDSPNDDVSPACGAASTLMEF